jgi:His/Glu/Gln/Arg/opine family amino acid ABC transporter permease subunit
MDAFLTSPGIEKLVEWSPILLAGFVNSIYIAVGGYLLGLIIGLAGAAGKLYGGLVTRDLLEVYTTVVRAVPELILILLLYYAGSDLLNVVMRSLGYRDADISGLAAGIVVIGLSASSRPARPMACRCSRSSAASPFPPCCRTPCRGLAISG